MIDVILHSPDTPEYIAYAKSILTNTQWLKKANVENFLDPTLHRLPLYPLLMALCMLAGGSNWEILVVIVQCVFLIYSLSCILRLSDCLGFSILGKRTLSFGYLTGLPLMYAFSILTDSLFLSFSIIMICNASIFLLEEENCINLLGKSTVCLLAVGFLRETGLYLGLFSIPLVALTWRNHKKKSLSLLKSIIIASLLPVFFLQGWNFIRCGNAVVSSGLSTALMENTLNLVNFRYPQATESPLALYLPNKPHISFGEGLESLRQKMRIEKKNIIEIQNEAKHSYVMSFFQYPTESFILFIKRLNRDILLVGLNPFNTLQEWWDPLAQKIPHLSQILKKQNQKVSCWETAHIVLINTMRLISLLLSLVGIFNVMRCFHSCYSPKRFVVLGLGFYSISMVIIYAAIHLEIRYVLSSIVFITFFAFIKFPLREQYV